jgi:hypothetical protein
MEIRKFIQSDRNIVIDLWRVRGLIKEWNDPDKITRENPCEEK